MEINKGVDVLAKILWNYAQMHQTMEKADVIAVFGSYNLVVAKRAIELFNQGYAPLIVFSGGQSKSTIEWGKSEAETMADIATKRGVPQSKILIEDQATNSGENTKFTRKILEEKGIDVQKIIVVQKPYMERRTYATIRKQWPEVGVVVTSPKISFDEYMDTSPIGKEKSMNVMVGDIQRVMLYPDMGYTIPQETPQEVFDAYNKLIALGYTKSLINRP